MSKDKDCFDCLHYAACLWNGEYKPTPCRLYEDKKDWVKKGDFAREIFDEIETVLYSVHVPVIKADGRIGGKTLDGLHIRIEDYNTIAKKYTEGNDEQRD